MSRTHDVTISGFDLSALESQLSHATTMANDRLEQIRRLEREVEAWRGVAAELAATVEHAGKPDHPSSWHTHHRTSALESYARLKSGFNSYEL